MQEAIEKIGKEVNGLTILVIAHRLTTISTANNLLFFRSRSELDSASKGTAEYNEIFEKLKNISYSYGEPVQSNGDESNENSEIDEIAEASQEEDLPKTPGHSSLNGREGINQDFGLDRSNSNSVNNQIQMKPTLENDFLGDEKEAPLLQ